MADDERKEEEMERKRKIQKELLEFLMENANKSPNASRMEELQKALETDRARSVLQVRKKDLIQPSKNPAKQRENVGREGDVVEGQFLIERKIKDGGFGQIYIAIDPSTEEKVAVKIEKCTTKPTENVEGIVLEFLQGQPNFPKLHAMGIKPTYMFLVMQLLGENLSDLRRTCALHPPRLSMSSAYRATIQFLKATQILHDTGFLHRDIKPSNFAVGQEGAEDRNVVYMLDFGLCRQYITQNGHVKKPRANAGFRGTVRYASVTAHERKDLSRRDDLWSLFYSFVELLSGHLPWRKTNDKNEVLKLKLKYSPKMLSQSVGPEMVEFCQHVSKLNFADRPDYNYLIKCFTRLLPQVSAFETDPYDWQLFDCRQMEHWTP